MKRTLAFIIISGMLTFVACNQIGKTQAKANQEVPSK